MGISDIFGLPAHPLLVHGAVVLTPLAAFALAVCALWPAARQRFGWAAAGLAVATALMVPFVVGSGESLKDRVTETALVERHEELGEQLLPWVGALALLGLAVMFVHGRRGRSTVPALPTVPARPMAPTLTSAGTTRGTPTGTEATGDTATAPDTSSADTPRWAAGPVVTVLTVLLLVAATGSMVQVARIGHSGAQAVWDDTATTPVKAPAADDG
jgi:hypothetical protein